LIVAKTELAPYGKPIHSNVTVGKFMLADVPARGEWLLERLVKWWPHLSAATFAGRLRAWINSNSHHFLKSPHSIGLFRVVRTELDPLPIAEDIFLFADEPGVHELEMHAIYRVARVWAKGLGCTRLYLNGHCDFERYDLIRNAKNDEWLRVCPDWFREDASRFIDL
jgi:hypothetical protein